MQLKDISPRLYGFGLLTVLIIGIASYLVVGRDARLSNISQLEREQGLLVRAAASNLKSFFDVFGESIAVLAQLKTITSETSSIWQLDVFVEQWRESGLVDGVALTDSQGNLVFNSNIEGTREAEEISLADRDYFLWAKNESEVGEYFVGKPVQSRLGASKGGMIVPVASPVYKDGTFVGVVVAAVELDRLTHRNLDLMQVSEETDIMLISEKGRLLYSNIFSEVIDSNFIDFLNNNPFPGSTELRDGIEKTLEENVASESLIIAFSHPYNKNIQKHTVAHSPVDLGSQKWVIVFASPTDDLWGFAVPMNVRIIVLFILICVTVFLFGVGIMRDAQGRLESPPPQTKEKPSI